MIESTTEISSLEGTSPRQTASISAHTVSNTLFADYGREKKYILFIITIGGIVVLFIYITRLASKEIFSQSNKIHREVGRAKDLTAPLYIQGADKSLARPGRKQATATEDFDVHISYL